MCSPCEETFLRDSSQALGRHKTLAISEFCGSAAGGTVQTQYLAVLNRVSVRDSSPRHAHLKDHPLLALALKQQVLVKKDAAALFEMCAGDGLASRMVRIKRGGPENNVFSIKCAIALANGQCGLPRVVPHGGEAIRFKVESRNASARSLCSVGIHECEFGLKKLTVMYHILPAGSFGYDGLSGPGEKGLDYIPFACKLRKKFLAGARQAWRLILILVLLRKQRCGNQQRRGDPFLHGFNHRRSPKIALCRTAHRCKCARHRLSACARSIIELLEARELRPQFSTPR